MAWLELAPSGVYQIAFRYYGRKIKKSTRTRDGRTARAWLHRVDENMRLVESGRLVVPEDADLGTAVKYFSFPESTIIRIYDVDSADQEIYLRVAFKPLMSATVVEDSLYEDWLEEIVDGAKWKLLSMPGKEWSDEKGAELCRRKYKQGIRRAKARVMNGNSTYPSQVRWRSFGEID